uniref:hypothetical protein n=1 Tax=Lyngbya confervoides TaxID=207921 RepID=UPI0035C92422
MVNGVAFVIRAELFRRYDANIISSFLLASPIMGVILGYGLLADPLNWWVGLGALFVAFGIRFVYQSS